MKRFDCLSLDCPILGPHLLEASAGTGKTFSIEHVVVRLLLNGMEIEKILLVTFTKAATRELKHRIRKNLEKALKTLKGEEEARWPYLHPLLGSSLAIQKIEETLALFDRSQIFTLHGFCYRMLTEFSFEANLDLSLQNPDEERKLSEEKQRLFRQFLAQKELPLCPEQMALCLQDFDSLRHLAQTLFRSNGGKGRTFTELFTAYRQALETVPSFQPILDTWQQIRGDYKMATGNLDRQIETLQQSLQHPENPHFFRQLIRDRATLFSFLDPANRKVRTKHNEVPFFTAISQTIGPIVKEASDKKKILATLTSSWKEFEKINHKEIGDPDDILKEMARAICQEAFALKVTSRFEAVIIDEFQDTDALQWEIFETLFSRKLKAFYLVGDPKQSIYRFRNADVYTYFAAKRLLGEEHHYILDTNFRSSPSLIGALNALFSRTWLTLPKTGESILYTPVRAGVEKDPEFSDGKKAIHWVISDEKSTFEETFLPYAVSEIERLGTNDSIALLVKDRYECKAALHLFKERGIPAVAKSQQPLGQTAALRELFQALAHPFDESLEKMLNWGSLAPREESLSGWKAHLEEKGLRSFFSAYLGGRSLPFKDELDQLLEELFAWEQQEGFSFEGVERFFQELEEREAGEGVRKRMEDAKGAVQVMTLHVSKGLEFDIVFAFGLSSYIKKVESEEEEEFNAEKLRQLYVAMTRAKKRLYVPWKRGASDTAPIHLFAQKVTQEEGDFLPYLERLSQTVSLSYEEISPCFPLSPLALPSSPVFEEALPALAPFQPSSLILSFTTLAQTEELTPHEEEPLPEGFTLETLPKGSETGVLVHQIFERIFSSSQPIWADQAALFSLIEKELLHTFLAAWLESMQQMIWRTLSSPLSDGVQTFSLTELSPEDLFVEMEFLFPTPSHFIKGFIDLVFLHRSRLYLVDWKTNVVKNHTLQETMHAHDYELQAALYAEALSRYFGPSFEAQFGGAFYLFLRTGEYVHLNPNPIKLTGRLNGIV